MAIIHWAKGQSGNWTTAADWVGHVPGAADTGVINAASSSSYTVTIDSPVAVAGLELNQTQATLLVSGSLASPDIDLQAGTLALSGASISGTVTDTGASVLLGEGNSTLDNVTWQGLLKVSPDLALRGRSTLTIQNGLTLTGANGSGPGAAKFDANVIFSNVGTLDNATITGRVYRGEFLSGTTSLVLGSHLTFNQAEFNLTAGQSIVNDGTIMSGGFYGGTLTNNGTMVGNSKYLGGIDLFTQSFTNNGLIVSTGVNYLNLQGLNAAGAGAAIDLNSGVLVLEGTLTTDQLFALYAAQHVVGSGSYGFGVAGNLDNTGKTLDVGQGTALGTLYSADITGGTVVDHGGNTLNGNLTNLTYQSASSTISTNGTWTNVTLTGVTTLDASGAINGGTLSGVGTIITGSSLNNSGLYLDGVDITGVGGSGHVVLDLTAGTASHSLEIGPSQSISGDTINLFGGADSLYLDGGAVLDHATINFANSTSASDLLWCFPIGTVGITLGAHLVVDVAAGVAVDVRTDPGAVPALVNMGQFNVAGTLSLGLIGYDQYSVDNQGSIDISAGGAFLAGTEVGAALTNGGTIAATDAVVSLGNGVDNTGLISATFTSAPGTFTISGAVTGAGTLAIDGRGTLSLGATVAAGQIVDFGLGQERLLFSNQAADTGFGGAIGGFAVGDTIEFVGKTVTSARFAGQSIVATLSTGGTIALATTTGLTGTLSVANSGGNAIITDGGAASSLRDWSAAPGAASLTAPAWRGVEAGQVPGSSPQLVDMHGWFGHHVA